MRMERSKMWNLCWLTWWLWLILQITHSTQSLMDKVSIQLQLIRFLTWKNIGIFLSLTTFSESLLGGEDQPLLVVDQARLQGKQFCAFAYQRKDSQNAWPTAMGIDLSKPTTANCTSWNTNIGLKKYQTFIPFWEQRKREQKLGKEMNEVVLVLVGILASSISTLGLIAKNFTQWFCSLIATV